MSARVATVAVLLGLASGCSLDFDRLRKPADADVDAAPRDAGPRDAGPRDGCVPRAETCDGTDEDCDGVIDVRPCVDPLCGAGTQVCVDGGFGACSTLPTEDVYDVEEDARVDPDEFMLNAGTIEVINFRFGPGLVQFARDTDFGGAEQVTVRVWGAVCADDCTGRDCTVAPTFREPGTLLLHALTDRFGETAVTWDSHPAPGTMLASGAFGLDSSFIDLVVDMDEGLYEAEDTRAFMISLADTTTSVYVARTHELAEAGDVGCEPEPPATQLIVYRCPP